MSSGSLIAVNALYCSITKPRSSSRSDLRSQHARQRFARHAYSQVASRVVQPSKRLHCLAAIDTAAVNSMLSPQLGPVRVVDLQGKGRGVVAARDIAPGEGLMRAVPLGLIMSAPLGTASPTTHDTTPAAPGLAPHKPSAASQQQQQQQRTHINEASLLEALQQALPGLDQQQQALLGILYAGPGADLQAGSDEGVPSAERLQRVVKYNATGMPSTDILLSRATGIASRAYIGLWPAHAMLNSACSPNACVLLEGEHLCVRACVPMKAGSEVTITYTGALGLAPLPVRQALLQRNHGFTCVCARCSAELALPPELQQLWGDVFGVVVQQLQPALAAATAATRSVSSAGSGVVGGQPQLQVQAVLSQLQQLEGVIANVLQQLQARPQEALWLEASLYVLYENLAKAAQLAGGHALYTQYLSKCLRLVGVANPGSDQHVQMAAKLVSSTSPVKEAPAGAAGTGSPEAAAAEQRLRLALQARYGIASAAVSVSTPDAVSAGATEMGNQPHGLAPAVSLAELRALAMVGLSGA